MIPKNKKIAEDLVRHFGRNWRDLAEFLDMMSLENFRGAPCDSAAFELGKRLRDVANYARDPYQSHKPKIK